MNNDELQLCALQMKMVTTELVDLAKKNEQLETRVEQLEKELASVNSQLYDTLRENEKLKQGDINEF